MVGIPAVVEAPRGSRSASPDRGGGPQHRARGAGQAAAALPGHVESLTLGGHAVLVYVPGAHAALATTRFRLVPTVDGRHRTLGARYRGIAGLSAGGFGAVNISIQHPGLFSWVASYSGVFTAPADRFGATAAANSPQLTAAGLPAAERVPLQLGQCAGDWEVGPDTTRFVATVQALGWAPLHTEVVPGPHGWQAWTVEARDSLTWLGGLWAPSC